MMYFIANLYKKIRVEITIWKVGVNLFRPSVKLTIARFH